uniref:Uncharacterized protein n=1 Tax=viral metagenome TaxID=1070528 RepID=A0A6H1ZW82_9ZZZZ
MQKYKHMLSEDVAIWNRFLARHKPQYLSVKYDIKVGDGMIIDLSWSNYIQKMAKDLSQKRIDVVAETEETTLIIEVKSFITIGVIGQVLGYVELYKRQFNPSKPLVPMVITNKITPDMQFLYDKFNIISYLV